MFCLIFLPFYFFTLLPLPLLKVYHRYSGSAELHVFVAERYDIGHCCEVLADELAQYSRAGTVQYAHAVHANEDGIINEISDGGYRLVATHAAHIEVLLEVQLAVVYRFARLTADVDIRLRLLLLGLLCPFEPVGTHLCAHVAEDYRRHLAVNTLYLANGGKPLYAHRVAGRQ